MIVLCFFSDSNRTICTPPKASLYQFPRSTRLLTVTKNKWRGILPLPSSSKIFSCKVIVRPFPWWGAAKEADRFQKWKRLHIIHLDLAKYHWTEPRISGRILHQFYRLRKPFDSVANWHMTNWLKLWVIVRVSLPYPNALARQDTERRARGSGLSVETGTSWI